MHSFWLILISVVVKTEGFLKINGSSSYPAFDPKFYESAIDPVKCQKQLLYMMDHIFPTVLFTDSSARIPKGIFDGNLYEFGNYHQCLSIDYDEDNMEIQGKYCIILVDLLDLARLLIEKQLPDKSNMKLMRFQLIANAFMMNKVNEGIMSFQTRKKSNISEPVNKVSQENITALLNMIPDDVGVLVTLGICIPKACSTRQAVNSSLFDNSDIELKTVGYKEYFCRLPNDKLWSPADTCAVIIFSLIGLITIISTTCDLYYRFILKKDLKNCYHQIFSVYTNGRRLVAPSPDTLSCLDGIRVMTMLWVIYGHSAIEQEKYVNAIETMTWAQSINSVYIAAAPLAVDTFFTLSGILLVYRCTKIKNGRELLKQLPFFYLSRIFRLFPILATVVLLQASLFHRLADGPLWIIVAKATDACRRGWWITLLYLQNFVFDTSLKCLNHSWYLAIDMHLYLLSPLVLYWILVSRRSAWIALITSLVAVLLSATIYNFSHNFMVNFIYSTRAIKHFRAYWNLYYVNVLTRASPFIVGMIFGYLLHTYRDKRVNFPWPAVLIVWMNIFFVLTSAILMMHYTRDEHWDYQIVDNLLCSFMRPAWAAAVGCLVFLCLHGYGGPIHWLLSLDLWRVPSRLCYGVYLFHGPMMLVIGDSMSRLDHFSLRKVTYLFVIYTSINFILSYFATLLIDAPFSVICKRIFEARKIGSERTKESTKL